ncbi:MAG: secondary thiamine-phosphate synthase enzyme YjbQ [Desulfocapsaceae bacterium]|nr:secondary thiamine-phosphate synthase enzyme YjbQ [Desulfocapsaceae bacterium]
MAPFIFAEGNMIAGKFSITTARPMEMIDITAMVSDRLRQACITQGTCTLFNPHTTAGLTINEGADPDVQQDIISGLQKIVPMAYPFKHAEGNSPAHIMASLTGSALTILIEDGQLVLGTWQRIFFCEFDGPRPRTVLWRILVCT